MVAVVENDKLGSLLKYEADKNYCREVVTLTAGTNYQMGAVLGQVTATGAYKLVSITEGETDGSDKPMGVLLQDVDATAGDKEGLIVARDAIVNHGFLAFPVGMTVEQKKVLMKGLEARGIVAREEA